MSNELDMRLFAFLGVLISVALLEYVRPKRKLNISIKTRWLQNLSLIILSTLTVKVLLPFTAVSVALYADKNQIGLFHNVPIPEFFILTISVILLDFIIYIQHVAFHRIPLLWRLHKVHHSDQEIDVTTGVRFHPIEIIISTLIKCSAVLMLGAPVIAVIIFEILLNATAMFNHGNIHLPAKLDKWMRLVLVTPDMHRVHHSVITKEGNSNFGFNLPWWDKIFKTYTNQPQGGHLKMKLGLQNYQDAHKFSLKKLLIMPFEKTK